jgi:hypothetical protein
MNCCGKFNKVNSRIKKDEITKIDFYCACTCYFGTFGRKQFEQKLGLVCLYRRFDNPLPSRNPLSHYTTIVQFPSPLIPTPHRRLRISHRRRRRRISHLRWRRPVPRRRRANTIPRRSSSSIPILVHRLVVALPRGPRVVASRMAVSSMPVMAVISSVRRRTVMVVTAVMSVTAMRVARVRTRVGS